jgi:hypothetical protein
MPHSGYASENEFQEAMVAHARANGWRAFFVPDWLYRLAMASMKRGRRSDRLWADKGFPDLMLAHFDAGRLIVAECKTDHGKVQAEQKRWLTFFRSIGAETYIWRYADTNAIIDLLQNPFERARVDTTTDTR